MKSQFSLSILIITVVLLSSCATMHFDNKPSTQTAEPITFWHHNFFFALYEHNAPISLAEICAGKDWSTVQTQKTFVDGLISGLANYLAPIWYPNTVTAHCDK